MRRPALLELTMTEHAAMRRAIVADTLFVRLNSGFNAELRVKLYNTNWQFICLQVRYRYVVSRHGATKIGIRPISREEYGDACSKWCETNE